MISRDEIELRLATTLAPMLVAVAVFALTAANLVSNATSTIVDELLSGLSAFCIFAAALLIDSALDKLELGFPERLTFLDGGYICFCLVVGLMTAAVPILYEARLAGSNTFDWHISFLLFIVAGVFVFMKMMTLEDHHVYTAGMITFYALSIYALGL